MQSFCKLGMAIFQKGHLIFNPFVILPFMSQGVYLVWIIVKWNLSKMMIQYISCYDWSTLEWHFELSDDSKCRCVVRNDWCTRLCKRMHYLKYGWCNIHYQWYLFKLNPA